MPRQTIVYMEGLKQLMKQYIIPILLLIFLASPVIADNWRELAPGIEYRDLGANLLTPWSHIHVFRIDLKMNQLDSILASKLDRTHASVDQFSQYSHALITINGGFFDHNYHPLGLRISEYKQQNPIKPISWWGVFYIKNQKPYLSSMSHYKNHQQIAFALQSGPRLLIKGKIPSLKPGLAERSALGITTDNRVIILITDNTPMTTATLAEIMQASPLHCIDALNLDGGSSTQLRANIGSFQIDVHGFSNVGDAIIVKPRQ